MLEHMPDDVRNDFLQLLKHMLFSGDRSPAENFIQSVFQKHRNLERQATPDQLRKPG